VNLNVEQDKSKPKLNLFDNIEKNENKIVIEQPKPKPKLSFFDEDDNAEPVKEKPKISFFNDGEI